MICKLVVTSTNLFRDFLLNPWGKKITVKLPTFTYVHNLSKRYAIILVGIKVLKTQDMFLKGSGSMRKGGAQKYISLRRYVNPP